MRIYRYINLQNLNTLKIKAYADYYLSIKDVSQLITIDPDVYKLPKLILGGGSNILLTRDWKGLIIKLENRGITKVSESNISVKYQVAAGENWHKFVKTMVNLGLGGVENMALIPGTVGGAVVQNIAAYGQNLEDICESVDYWDWEKKKTISISKNECKFTYRHSIFKDKLAGKAMVISAIIKLHKKPKIEDNYYSLAIKHESIKNELARRKISKATVKDIYLSVISIRKRQLLDWKKSPTAGSFFKNPVVSMAKYIELSNQISELQQYPADKLSYNYSFEFKPDVQYVKIPAGRLLDYLGWRGKTVNHCFSSPKHALIVTHDGKATGVDLLNYVNLVKKDVKTKLGIDLETEIVIV